MALKYKKSQVFYICYQHGNLKNGLDIDIFIMVVLQLKCEQVSPPDVYGKY